MVGREVILNALLSPEVFKVGAFGGALLASTVTTKLISVFNIKDDIRLVILKNIIIIVTYVGALLVVGDKLLTLTSSVLTTFKLL